MSHHGEIDEITAPRSKFYQGPYGRMFRNLPPHVPTIDLIEGLSVEVESFEDLPEEIYNRIRDILPATSDEFTIKQFNKIQPIGQSYQDKKEDACKIAQEVEDAYLRENTEAGREAILKLLARTMIETEEQSADSTRDNPDIAAGYTYFIQYITHDITFDPTSSLMRLNDPNKLRNFRTPRLDLDSLYGGGPDISPFMYQYSTQYRNQKYYLLFDTYSPNGEFEEDDLPRNQKRKFNYKPTGQRPETNARALIGDMRNDQTIMISQLHLAFIKFHNAVMDWLEKYHKLEGKRAFSEAQRLVRWHYQWVILHDFLPKFVDHEILDNILTSPGCPGQPNLCYYQWRNQPFIPVEFSVAAFRFGHSMIRNSYTLNYHLNSNRDEAITIIVSEHKPTDLILFDRLRTKWTIQWDHFLNINNHSNPQKSRQIDTQLSHELGELHIDLVGGRNQLNLAARDLLRGYKMELPSGQAVARAMGIIPLDDKDEPLWYYILREAKELRGGRKLGPVGGRIVAEVIIGLLAGDPHSFLSIDPNWQPVLPREDGNPFELQDILRFAKMPLTEKQLRSKFEGSNN